MASVGGPLWIEKGPACQVAPYLALVDIQNGINPVPRVLIEGPVFLHPPIRIGLGVMEDNTHLLLDGYSRCERTTSYSAETH
jgi:hypothetical protein